MQKTSPITTSKENEVYEVPGTIPSIHTHTHTHTYTPKKGEEIIEEGQKDEGEEERREEKEEKGKGKREGERKDGIVSWGCVGTICFADKGRKLHLEILPCPRHPMKHLTVFFKNHVIKFN